MLLLYPNFRNKTQKSTYTKCSIDEMIVCLQDMYQSAVDFMSEGVPVEGLGCQGHVKDHVKPHPTTMWASIITPILFQCSIFQCSSNPTTALSSYMSPP